ncbi:hypothetical protein D0Z07_3322 [Hyphodiscus hymeniophilus]|uniref:Aquaporin-like protein n=1 Tax=Hyphodiscus hymeniophilus TaxID=353542 RepID=A0A9P6VMG2_9HELO|nr:hypothetical protein D0Z07_3322 [Hyphodiscus hymeniophilus]
MAPDDAKQSHKLRQTQSTNSRQTSANGVARTQHPNLHKSQERPQYSLAGNTTYAHGPSFVDPGYHELNPTYQRTELAPVWGLAKPLPRVVRRGMRRGKDGRVVEDPGTEREEPGDAEPIPQLGMIDDQRQEAGKEVRDGPDTDERGYGHERAERRRIDSTVGRMNSENSVLDRYATPRPERGNPMEEWKSHGSTYRRSHSDPFDEQSEDLGDRRLPKVQEVPSQHASAASSVSVIGKVNEVDLEAGDVPDEWALEEDEAERYTQEAYDDHNLWSSIRARFREPLAECLATMIAVLIGLCTNLAVQTSANTSGIYLSTNWAWGLGVMIGIYIAGGISGGHLNPAISLMLSLYRGFPFRKALVYITAQVLGAFFAGLIAYGVYRDAIVSFDLLGGQPATETGATQPLGLFTGGSGKSFFTQPAPFASVGAGFINEFVATAILACAVLALGDDSNAPPGAGMHALIVGLVVTVLTMAFGYNTGACMNPARDFGPRIATAAVGYGSEVFTTKNAWWIYGAWGATISGALVGGFLYDVAIFVGGESPVNYPRSKKREVKNKAKRRWFSFKRSVNEGLRKDPDKHG